MIFGKGRLIFLVGDDTVIRIEVAVALKEGLLIDANSILTNFSQGHTKSNFRANPISIGLDMGGNHNILGLFSQGFKKLNHSHMSSYRILK